jgi:membrane-associated phospholipid phosphatase
VPFLLWAAYALAFAGHVAFRAVGDEVFTWRSLAATEAPVFGVSASDWLQSRFYGDGSYFLDRLATGLHLFWFAFPLVIGVALTVWRRRRLLEYLAWLTLCWYVADFGFLLLPVIPPWMDDPALQRILLERGWIEYASLDSNPVAAFPSLHAGIPLAVALFLWFRVPGARWAAAVSAVVALLTGAAVLYLGEHWLLDVVAGWALAGFVAWLFVSRSVRTAIHRIPGDPLLRIQQLDARIADLGCGTVSTASEAASDPGDPPSGRRAA